MGKSLCGGSLAWLLVAWASTSMHAEDRSLIAWAQFTGSGVSVRAIVKGAECPAASVDGKSLVLTVREISSEQFPVTACQAAAPRGSRFALVGEHKLALEPLAVKRVVVVGDTGCRLKGAQVQDCNDPVKWPFSIMTRNAAAKHPDLVIHVGDYYYRETPCPTGREGCTGSPHGDSWESWRADFFDPASTLLAAAPWVFARGNHEQCGRGADGWFRFLDAGAIPLTCPATAEPFAVSLGALRLQVIDSADVLDKQLSIDRLAFYQTQLNKIPAATGRKPDETWVLTHKPLWGYELMPAAQDLMAQNPLIAAAAGMVDKPRSPQLPNVDLLLAGHIHLFGTLDFSGRPIQSKGSTNALRPAQLIVGDSGTALDVSDVRSGEQMVDGIMAKYAVKDTFGYFVMDREKRGWTGTLYSINDAVLAKCQQRGRQIECVPSTSK
jgi:hypothetical protein